MGQVKGIVIDSPLRNWSYKLNMVGNRLLVAGGNFYYPEVDYAGTAMKYEKVLVLCMSENKKLFFNQTQKYYRM